MSHVHWDHIMGFPFFPPAYIPGNTIRIHGGHSLAVLEEAFRRQQSDPCFPVQWDQLRANIEFRPFWTPNAGTKSTVCGSKRSCSPILETPTATGSSKNGKAVVYSTDAEHKLQSESETEGMVEFYRGADLVVFDAMYLLNEMINAKQDWGHSSNVVGVDLCLRAASSTTACFITSLPTAMRPFIPSSARRGATPRSPATVMRSKSPTAYDGVSHRRVSSWRPPEIDLQQNFAGEVGGPGRCYLRLCAR